PFHRPAPAPPPPPPPDPEDEAEAFAFATEAEEDAYWAGVADGIRNGGGLVSPRLSARARDAYPELVATAAQKGRGRHPAELELDFDPASTRHRHDGITPERQRDYVEALADTGIARYAAARIGVSPQAINRLRRRPEARSFDLACAAARRIGARRLHDIGWERAIEGQIRRHYYHGELKSEERVFDNRLLVYLMGKTEHLLDEPEETPAVAARWTPWVEALAGGAPPPDLAPPAEDAAPASPDIAFDGNEVWVDEDNIWWTRFPPPACFDGLEQGEYGGRGYRRTLSAAEAAAADARAVRALADDDAFQRRRRDHYFGFAGGAPEDEVFPLMEAETLNLPDPAAGAPDGPPDEMGATG
ncbi:MAG TPA: hypothetical protein VMG08_18435, partial [Allosphingosinicella sp.]|nr:hypothetical protein [Allosphingosinicella sp.]